VMHDIIGLLVLVVALYCLVKLCLIIWKEW
jgi:hypothetical protein